MLPSSLAFVDVETTGSSPFADRVIEIGIVRVENGQVEEFSTLLDPDMSVSPFIQDLTGIDSRELVQAPSFYEVKDEVAKLLEGAIFVAHNARFDYSFLRHEFKRFDMNFSPKQLCTVKLSRRIFPQYRKHDLSSIIERYSFNCEGRHRALGDAKVLWDFYQMLVQNHDPGKLAGVIADISKRPSLPPKLAKKYLDKLPEAPGVYTFYDKGDTPLYIGKSINVRDRVLSHFSSDYTSARRLEMVSLIEHIDVVPTAGDLSAQLLESEMIKSFQPLFNRQLRNSRKVVVLKKTQSEDGYFACVVEEKDHIEPEEIEDVLGVFRSKKQIKDYLSGIVKEHSLCQKHLGLEKTTSGCFAYHLGWCRGACIGKERSVAYNMRFAEAMTERRIKSWPFEGPVIITESYEEFSSTLLIDKWCIVKILESGSTNKELSEEWQNFDIENIITSNVNFDYDAYKILLRYMRNHHHLIKPFRSGKSLQGYIT